MSMNTSYRYETDTSNAQGQLARLKMAARIQVCVGSYNDFL